MRGAMDQTKQSSPLHSTLTSIQMQALSTIKEQ